MTNAANKIIFVLFLCMLAGVSGCSTTALKLKKSDLRSVTNSINQCLASSCEEISVYDGIKEDRTFLQCMKSSIRFNGIAWTGYSYDDYFKKEVNFIVYYPSEEQCRDLAFKVYIDYSRETGVLKRGFVSILIH